jgi:hypothetical protein
MWSKHVGLGLFKDICEVVVFLGIEERSVGVDWDMEEAQAEMSLRLSVNCCVPGSSQARRKATALTREMSTFGVAVGVSGIFGVGLSSRVLELESSEDDCGSISSETVVHMEGLESDMGFSLSVVGKMILLNTQSINRL